jgi:hypothetical protein
MNKLAPEHLHLLLDEPIYVLNSDHFESQEQNLVSVSENVDAVVTFEGENKKGILIFIGKESEDQAEDKSFLFKGLNALNILVEDVALIEDMANLEMREKIGHTSCLQFSNSTAEENLYELNTNDSITMLECHSISQIRQSEDLKRKFWQALKALFQQ